MPRRNKKAKFRSVSEKYCALLHKKGTALQKLKLEKKRITSGVSFQFFANHLQNVYESCAEVVGSKKLETLIQYEAGQWSKYSAIFSHDQIAEQAVAKYKRSHQHQQDLKEAKKQQKAKDIKDFKKKQLDKSVTQLKMDLAKVMADGATVLMMQQWQSVCPSKPRTKEKRPKWMDLRMARVA